MKSKNSASAPETPRKYPDRDKAIELLDEKIKEISTAKTVAEAHEKGAFAQGLWYALSVLKIVPPEESRGYIDIIVDARYDQADALEAAQRDLGRK